MAYSRIAQHAGMLFDAHRNEAYARAIRRLVAPGSVVMDLGAGLGLHGLLAAAAGARRVYLVEPEPVVHAALDAARTAGLADRITVVQQRIEDAVLPERVDAIVSVFTGNLLFSEDLLLSLFHARDRWLAPGGVMIPDRAQLWLAPLHAPRLHREHVARWSQPVLGFDYGAGRVAAANEIPGLRRSDFAGTARLSPGGVAVDIDLATATDAACEGRAECEVTQGGECHGLVAWIGIHLGGEWLSTEPDAPDVHWTPVMLPIDPPLSLEKGETLRCTLQRPPFGDWTWTLAARAGTRRQSSFLAAADGPRELARIAPQGRPGLGNAGARALRVLEGLRAGESLQAIADSLPPRAGESAAARLREVQQLARRYGGSA